MDYPVFWALALPLVLAAVGVILHPSPVYSALALVLALFLLAVYFLFLGAHLVAWLQIIVYAGAIMVLFLFVIMLLNLQQEAEIGARRLRPVAWLGGGLLVLEIWLLARGIPDSARENLPEGFGTVAVLGAKLFTDFLLPFEITSVLLLVAIVGAVVLAKRRL